MPAQEANVPSGFVREIAFAQERDRGLLHSIEEQMSLEQLTGRQMDAVERFWIRVMLASGATLMTALGLIYVFWSDSWTMLVCGAVAVASIFFLSIAAAKLRELELGLIGSDRAERSNMDSALDGLDD